jgi:hypothetical protein
MPHPPYSPNLAPADFFLFPKIKTSSTGRYFQTTDEIQENTTRELRSITESAFQEAFQQWKNINIIGRNVGNGVSPVEGTTLKGTVLKML